MLLLPSVLSQVSVMGRFVGADGGSNTVSLVDEGPMLPLTPFTFDPKAK